jgi:hypothetical protein
LGRSNRPLLMASRMKVSWPAVSVISTGCGPYRK